MMKHGHKVYKDGDCWRYKDTNEKVEGPWHTSGPLPPGRPCGFCGKFADSEGRDDCLGELPNVTNACCGHSPDGEGHEGAYIHFCDGKALRDQAALDEFDKMGVGPKHLRG